MHSHVRRVVVAGADALCPERCAACPMIVPAGQLFCHGCRLTVNVFGPPECGCCGASNDARGPCEGGCPATVAPIRCARAWAEYEPAERAHRPVAQALVAFKYGRVRRLGRRLAAAMVACVPAGPGAIIAPIPLHPHRLRRRGFNQSAVLARHLALILRWPLRLQLLARVRDTPSQTALSARARAANVDGAFAVREPAALRARGVLLIDDVWTSGATARAAARALSAAGAASVDVVTFARVL